MKGKGDRDVYVLQDYYLEPEPERPLDRKQSFKKSFIQPQTSDRPGNISLIQPFDSQAKRSDHSSSPSQVSPFRTFGKLLNRGMPLIKEQNEDRPEGTGESEARLSKGDLDSSHESYSKSNSSHHDDDKHTLTRLHQDMLSTSRNNVLLRKSMGTKIPTIAELERSSPFTNENIDNVDSLRKITMHMPDLEAIEEEIESPGLRSMRKRLMDEAALAGLTPRSPFLRSSVKLSSNSIGKMNSMVLTPIRCDNEEVSSKSKAKSNDSSRRGSIDIRVKEMTQTDNNIGLEDAPINRPVVLLDTPDKNPRVIKAANQLRRHRTSITMEHDDLRKRIALAGADALQEIQTPQDIKRPSLRDRENVSKRIGGIPASNKLVNRENKIGISRRPSKEDFSINLSRRASMDDIGSDTISQKSSQDSDEHELNELVDNENTEDNSRAIIQSKRFVDDFNQKLILRYPHISNICLGVVCLDMLISEVTYFIDPIRKNLNSSFNITYFGIAFLLILVIVGQLNRNKLMAFKLIVLGLLFLRLIGDFIEIYLLMDGSIQK